MAVLLLQENEIDDKIQQAVDRALAKYNLSQLSSEDEDEVLDIDGAVRLTKRKKPTIYELVAQKKIPFSKPGKNLIFFRSELLLWLKSHRRKTSAELTSEAESQFLKANKAF